MIKTIYTSYEFKVYIFKKKIFLMRNPRAFIWDFVIFKWILLFYYTVHFCNSNEHVFFSEYDFIQINFLSDYVFVSYFIAIINRLKFILYIFVNEVKYNFTQWFFCLITCCFWVYTNICIETTVSISLIEKLEQKHHV